MGLMGLDGLGVRAGWKQVGNEWKNMKNPAFIDLKQMFSGSFLYVGVEVPNSMPLARVDHVARHRQRWLQGQSSRGQGAGLVTRSLFLWLVGFDIFKRDHYIHDPTLWVALAVSVLLSQSKNLWD